MTVLEKTTHVCLIAVSMAAGGILVRQQLTPDPAHKSQPADFIGKRLDMRGLPQRPIIVAVISSHCPFCIVSAPLYRRLGAVSSGGGAVRGAFVIVSSESQQIMNAFLAAQGISTTMTMQASLSWFGVRATPTLLVVDKDRKIVNAFVGVVSEGMQPSLLSFLRNGV